MPELILILPTLTTHYILQKHLSKIISNLDSNVISMLHDEGESWVSVTLGASVSSVGSSLRSSTAELLSDAIVL